MADVVKHNFGTAGLLKRNVLIQKDENGFGLTVSGDNPVYVQSVKPGSAADKAGVEVGDKIIKVNGTLVTESNHIEVVSLIKSGSYVALTLLGKDNKQQGHTRTRSLTGIIPTLSSLQQQNTQPSPPYNTSPSDANKSDRIKDVERTLNYERDYNKAILEKYKRAPSPKTQIKLAESKTRISALEKQLQYLSGSIPDKSGTPYRPVLQPVEPRDRPPSHNPPDFSSLSSRSSGSHSSSNIQSLSNYTHIERTERIDEATQHSHLGSSSTPNLGMSLMNNRSRMENDIFEGHSTIEPVAEETTTDNGMDWMKAQFEQARRMENSFGCVQNNSSEDIYSMEDGEFSDEEPLDKHGPFESLDLLKDKKAHLAVFLHYLISNSDPTPLFFWVVTDIYSNEQRSDNVKEWKKWGYEIYSTFVAQSAPLKVNIGGDAEEKMIEEALQTTDTTENRLRNIFSVARMKLKPDLEERLGEFRQKRLLGLGAMFGDRQLEDDMDRAAELKIVEITLMPHLDALLGEQQSSTEIQNDKNLAMACAIATLMKSAGLSGKVSSGKGTSLERCRSFAEKEKSSYMNITNKFKKSKVHMYMGHQFQSFQYSSVTLCNVCNGLLWGIGIQGQQCQSCEFNVHPRNCMENIKEMCTVKSKILKGRDRKDRRTQDIEYKKPDVDDPSTLTVETRSNRGSSMTEEKSGTDADEPTAAQDSESDRGTPTPSEDAPTTPQQKSKSLGKRGRQELRSKSQINVKKGGKTPENGNPPSPYPRVESQSPQPESEEDDFSDSDFDVEQAVPPWSEIVDKKIIKRLKSREIKRQEVIHELLHTEKTHVRNLKILDRIFYRNIKKSNTLQPEEINKIFPNLEELIKIHESLLDQLKERAKLNQVIENIGDIMLGTFGGESKENVKETFATFCRQQTSALAEWKTYRENRKEFAATMTRLEANIHCRRLQFGAILASTHQRLVKYPLLLESLNKTTPDYHTDYKNVEQATECCKYILNYVNDEIKRCEDELRLVELSKIIEVKRTIRPDEEEKTEEKTEKELPVGQFDILQHKLVMEGDLVWKINLKNQPKRLDLHVVLLNDTLVLLTKQDEKYILKTHNVSDNKGHSPLIPMSKALIREVATDRKAFFLVSTSTKQPHIYELVATTHLEQKSWVDNINRAIEINKTDDYSHGRRPGPISNTPSATTSPTPPTTTPTTPSELEEEGGREEEEAKVRGNSETSEHLSDEEHKSNGKEESGHSDESDEDEKSSTTHVLSKEKREELNDQLSENETDLRRLIAKRSTILSELDGGKYNPFNMESSETGPTKLVISAIEQVDQLHDIFGQFSQTVSEEQRDRVSQSITGLQRYLKDILDVICTTTNRHDSCTDSLDGEKDVERDSKRNSSKTYSSDMTDSLPRHSPLGDAILSTSPPPILISRTSQEQDNGVEECVANHEDLSTAVMSGADDVSPLKMAEPPLSPTNGSSPKLESGVLITSPFKIQKLRKRPSDPSQQDSVSKLTSKLTSFTEQTLTDSSDSE